VKSRGRNIEVGALGHGDRGDLVDVGGGDDELARALLDDPSAGGVFSDGDLAAVLMLSTPSDSFTPGATFLDWFFMGAPPCW
jgi:hypothetical protein